MTDTLRREAEKYRSARRSLWDRNAYLNRSWGGYYRARLQQVYRHIVPEGASVLEVGCGRGDLLAALRPGVGVGIDFSEVMISLARQRYPKLQFIVGDAHEIDLGERRFDYIVLSDLLNDLWDVQCVLDRVRACCESRTRIICNYYSHLWQGPLWLARRFGIAAQNLPQNWLTHRDMTNLFELTGFQTLRSWQEVLVPLAVPGISNLANRYLSKISPFRFFALANLVVARPKPGRRKHPPKVSVVVPARNEAGHIAELISRIPVMGAQTEIIFIEGHSSDGTYAAIEQAIADCRQGPRKLLKQPGFGKGDAVRAGFAAADGDILMILDADLTVPPEDLRRFYDLMIAGDAEFASGVRLVYPMEDRAMQFANLLGNKFFSWAFSWLLGQPIRDTLCGTKTIWASDYRRLAANRAHFGEFDPFGDFDLLFGAAKLSLKITEVPIRYRARRFGKTNIQRWRHGALLLRMVIFAARRIKFV